MNVQLSKKNGNELRVRVPYREDWVARIKQMSFRRWDPVDQAWIIPYTTGSLTELLTLLEGIGLRIDEVLLEESELLADYDWRIAPVELRTIAFEGSSWDYVVKRQYVLRLKLGGYSRQTVGHIRVIWSDYIVIMRAIGRCMRTICFPHIATSFCARIDRMPTSIKR